MTTYYRYEVLRELREPVGLLFTLGLPAFMYLVFGATQAYGQQDIGHGNVAAHVMISMAVYGAMTATTTIGAAAALEKRFGWGRQLGLTPLPDSGFVLVKVALAVTMALVAVAAVYALGAATGAHAEVRVWVLSALGCVAGALLFALYGLAFGLGMRSRSAVGVASGTLVLLAFLGGLFTPLSGTMLQLSRFTPVYGAAALARAPLTEGAVMTADGLVTDPTWWAVVNLAAWLTVLSTLSVVFVRRGRNRQ